MLTLQFTAQTNMAGGVGSFACYDLLSVTMRYVNNVSDVQPSYIQSCRWLSTTLLSLSCNDEMLQQMKASSQYLALSVALKPSSGIKALAGGAVSFGRVLLPIDYPLVVSGESPTVSLSSSVAPASPVITVAISYVPVGNSPSMWSTSSGSVSMRWNLTAGGNTTELSAKRQQLSAQLTSVLSTALTSVDWTNRLLVAVPGTIWRELIAMATTRVIQSFVGFQFRISLCDSVSRCGVATTTAMVNVSAAAAQATSSGSTLYHTVSLSPSPVWKGSCQDDVVLYSTLRLFRSSSLSFNVTVVNAAQVDWRQYELTWQLLNASTGLYTTVVSQSKSPLMFRYPFRSLANTAASQYNAVRLQATNMGTGYVAVSDNVALRGVFTPLVLSMVPSQTAFTVTLLQSITLNASLSYDPDLLAPTLIFTWRCRSFANTALQGVQLSLLSDLTRQRMALPRCLVNITFAAAGRPSVVTLLPGFSSALNTTTEVFLTIADSSRPSRDSVTTRVEVMVIAGSPTRPMVQVLTPQSALTRVNAQNALAISATVSVASTATAGRQVDAAWSWVSSPYGAAVTPIRLRAMTLNNATTTRLALSASSPSTKVTLSLRPAALVEGSYYSFRLTCDGVTADVTVTTNANPVGGSLTVVPATGYSLETSFTATAPLWRDVDGDYPLTYTFAILPPVGTRFRATTWVQIPSFTEQWFVDAVYLPPGWSNLSYALPVQCTVVDTLSGEASIRVNATVLPMRSNGGGNATSGAASSQQVLSTLMTLIANASVASSPLRLQQVVTVVAALVRRDLSILTSSSTSGGSSQEKPLLTSSQLLTLAGVLVANANATVAQTDSSQQSLATSLVVDTTQLVTDSKVAIAQESAAKALSSLVLPSSSQNNTNGAAAVSQIASQTSNVLNLLAQNLLASQSGASGGIQVVQVSTDTVKLSVALVSLPPPSTNSSVVSFLPAVGIADSSTTINIAQGGSGSALISVASYDSSLWDAAVASQKNSSTSTSTGLPAPQLVSDVVSIKVSYTGTDTAQLPSFVASMEVSDDGSYVAPVFEHNCSIGVPEHLSFLCSESLVRMNLTCTGKSAAVVRHVALFHNESAAW